MLIFTFRILVWALDRLLVIIVFAFPIYLVLHFVFGQRERWLSLLRFDSDWQWFRRIRTRHRILC